ncbi:MAG: sporulation protein YqfC [Firmicutes bacterium]|nr:sporulation protein YqfC [Bacillota bacterium]
MRLARGRGFVSRWVVDGLELPREVVMDLPRISIIGDGQVKLENYRGLLEFSPDLVRIKLARGELAIKGDGLAIKSLFPEELTIEGKIAGLSFEE